MSVVPSTAPVAIQTAKPRAAAVTGGMRSKLQTSRIPGLDGIRGVSAAAVLVYHMGYQWFPATEAMMAFFGLSGFLITWLLLKEKEKYGSISIPDFYKRRALRIFPAFYVYWTGMVFLLSFKGHHFNWADTFSAFFYVSNYYQGIVHPGEGTFVSHTWSLGVEEQFYLLWPMMFYIGSRNIRRLARFLVGLIVSVWIYRAILALLLHVHQGYLYRAFDTRIDHLMIGCLVAIIIKENLLPSICESIFAKPYSPIITLTLLVISGIYTHNSFLYRDVIGAVVEPVLLIVFMLQMVSLSKHAAWSWFDSSPMRFLGQISYSFYLYHPPIAFGVTKMLAGSPVFVRMVAAVLATTIVASVSHYAVERPFLKLKDRLVPSRMPLGRAAVVAD